MKKNIWIVGCSSGIGLQLLKLYLKNGHSVVASSRNANDSYELKQYLKDYKSTLKLVNLDVQNIDDIKEKTKEVFSHFITLDLLIFNAGVYESMSSEQINIKYVESMMDINYLGAVRLTKEVIPYFYKQDFGRFVFNGSLSSYFALPYSFAYSASKSALVSFAQSIQPELLQRNIETQIINHGFVKTRLTDKNDFEMPQLMSTKEAALNIYKGIQSNYKFEISFPFKMSFFLKLLNILPYKISLFISRKLLK